MDQAKARQDPARDRAGRQGAKTGKPALRAELWALAAVSPLLGGCSSSSSHGPPCSPGSSKPMATGAVGQPLWPWGNGSIWCQGWVWAPTAARDVPSLPCALEQLQWLPPVPSPAGDNRAPWGDVCGAGSPLLLWGWSQQAWGCGRPSHLGVEAHGAVPVLQGPGCVCVSVCAPPPGTLPAQGHCPTPGLCSSGAGAAQAQEPKDCPCPCPCPCSCTAPPAPGTAPVRLQGGGARARPDPAPQQLRVSGTGILAVLAGCHLLLVPLHLHRA